MNTKGLVEFLIKAKRSTYAGDGNEVEASRPGSRELRYVKNNLEYVDWYFGSDCFIGEEALRQDNQVIWVMNYSGRKLSEKCDYGFLKKALLLVPLEKPFRGPNSYTDSEYKYKCDSKGDFDWFSGYETIELQGEVVYECYFHGGIVK